MHERISGMKVDDDAPVDRPDASALLAAEARAIRIPIDNVEEIVPQKKSIMPDRMLRDMAAQEAADLLAYLVSLRAPPPAKENASADPAGGIE